MSKTIVHTFSFFQPPAVVWEYLTNAELIAQWLMPNDFKPIVGHQFQFKTKPRINFGFDGTVYCEVLEIVPLQKLVYSWKGGMGREKPALNSVVTWTLTPTPSGTDLHLEHKGFKMPNNFMAFVIMNMGWAKILKRMNNLKKA